MAISNVYADNGDLSVNKKPGVSTVHIDNMPEGGGGSSVIDVEVNGSSVVDSNGVAQITVPAAPTLASLNTAGITDIQQVNALPAEPVSTVLYLVPET